MQKQDDTQEPKFYWDTYNASTVGKYLSKYEGSFIQNALSVLPQHHQILDIACGSGRFTKMLHDIDTNIVGADLNMQALKVLHRHSLYIDIIQADALQLPFTNECFDGVLAIQCVGYFNYQRFLAESKRVLRKEGLLVFSFVNDHNYKRILQRLLQRPPFRFPAGDICYYQMIKLLYEYGFKAEKAYGYNWIPFNRNSNNHLVQAFVMIEQFLGLNHYLSSSPWVLIAARKR